MDFSIRPTVIIAFVLGLTALVGVWEMRVARGPRMDCVVEEVLPGSKGVTLFARCDGVLTKVPVSDIAARLHGQPGPGGRIEVLETKRGTMWDKPASRHAVGVILAPLAVLLSLFLWWRRTA